MQEVNNTFKISFADSYASEFNSAVHTWSSFKDLFRIPEIGTKEGRCYVAADMPDGRRSQSLINTTSLIIFDLDSKGDSIISTEDIVDAVKNENVEAILHSTFSHTENKPRLRLICKTSSPIDADKHKQVLLSAADKLGIAGVIDRACIEPSRLFYLPRCPMGLIDNYVFKLFEGDPIDVDSCLNEAAHTCALNNHPPYARMSDSELAETAENIEVVNKMLGCVDPDSDYATWRSVIWSLRSLGWVCSKQIALAWSKKSSSHWGDTFAVSEAQEAIDNLFDNFDSSKNISIGTLRHHATRGGWLSVNPFQVIDEVPIFDEIFKGCDSPLARFRDFSITGDSDELRKQMLADVFVMKDVALLGQWTAIYASPNMGKTLLTLWMLCEQIKANVIDGDKVFYINADDNYKGMIQKLEIAEKYGFHMLVPNFNGYEADDTVAMIKDLAVAKEARNVVVVLDTLKKFTDLMNKQKSSDFGRVARGFIAAGGTLIVLAHNNKHPDAEGNAVFGGTTDILDDADCGFIIDNVAESGDAIAKITTVRLNNKKARGDVPDAINFNFTKTLGEPYNALFDSVQRLDSDHADLIVKKKELELALEHDADSITAVLNAIDEGINTKTGLVGIVKKRIGESHNRIRKVIEKFSGPDYSKGHRWTKRTGERGVQIFTKLPPP